MAKYAIIKTGSKQYKVSEGDVIDVELLGGKKSGPAEPKSEIEFKDVLFLYDGNGAKIGSPTVDGASVKAVVVDEVRGPKVVAYKYKKRKSYHRKVGHRQDYIRVKITEV